MIKLNSRGFEESRSPRKGGLSRSKSISTRYTRLRSYSGSWRGSMRNRTELHVVNNVSQYDFLFIEDFLVVLLYLSVYFVLIMGLMGYLCLDRRDRSCQLPFGLKVFIFYLYTSTCVYKAKQTTLLIYFSIKV